MLEVYSYVKLRKKIYLKSFLTILKGYIRKENFIIVDYKNILSFLRW